MSLAQLLQLAGMVVVGAGLVQGLATGDVKRELLLLGIGVVLFVAGWLLAKRGTWRG